jgi:hypothetical protein
MLVHMNPVEVAGLRAAAKKMGGDLTTNPKTGQPEAFLPFLIGMGLQGLGMSALGAGIATGLGTAAVTKDLGQGVMAGLGAYGGAGIGEGLGAASSAASATPTAGADIMAGASQSTPVAGLPGATPLPESLLPPSAPMGSASFAPTPATPLMPSDVMTSGGDIGLASSSAPGTMPIGYTQPIAPSTPSTFAEPISTGTEMAINESLMPPSKGPLDGIEALGTKAGRAGFMEGVGGTSGLLTSTAFGLAPYALEQPDEFNAPKQNSLIRPYDYDPTTRRFTARTPYRAPGPEYMAQGGLAGLTGYKEGNILRGQGDGMSDEIKASIDGEQDVLLSDGEYVIPADAVAMLGNGSTDAGANRLDAMIARLRTQKYGRNKQPPEMKAESVMPA